MALTILIIDDDPDFIASTSEILEAQEYQVISSPSGIEGFEKAKQIKPNLILLDVMMEDAGTGLDIAKKLRDDQDTADIPVLIMTGIDRAGSTALRKLCPWRRMAQCQKRAGKSRLHLNCSLKPYRKQSDNDIDVRLVE